MSSYHEIKSVDEFNDNINNNDTVVAYFHATWCGPCKIIAPQLEGWVNEYTNIKYLKIDVDEHGDLSLEYNIRAMPTLIFFKDHEEVGRVEGAHMNLIEENLRNLIAS